MTFPRNVACPSLGRHTHAHTQRERERVQHPHRALPKTHTNDMQSQKHTSARVHVVQRFALFVLLVCQHELARTISNTGSYVFQFLSSWQITQSAVFPRLGTELNRHSCSSCPARGYVAGEWRSKEKIVAKWFVGTRNAGGLVIQADAQKEQLKTIATWLFPQLLYWLSLCPWHFR